MFEAEAAALRELAAAEALRVPRPICCDASSSHAWLVCEYLPLTATPRVPDVAAAWRSAGRGLAALHRVRSAQFGWHRDNWIGSTPQPNGFSDDWVTFFRQQRLQFQLQLAAQHGFTGALQRKGERVLAEMELLFDDYQPLPSLLHGDLWRGNLAFVGVDGVIFDPALYYGDRESDLAMSELFGGFASAFYAGYREAWPLDGGYARRRPLYQLYHLLNHLNIFGGGYAADAEAAMDRLLAAI